MVLKPSLFRYCIYFIVGCFVRQILFQFDKNYWVIVNEVLLYIDSQLWIMLENTTIISPYFFKLKH